MFLLLVKLAQTDSHLAASGPRSRDNDKRTSRHDIIITSETLIRIDKGHVVGITLDGIMHVCLYPKTSETLTECIGTGLSVIMGYHH